MAKKREPDKLALDMMQCLKDGFGCHYGWWKANQERPVVVENKDEIPEGWIACGHCGKPFKPYSKRQIYCDIGCQKTAQAIRDRDKDRERRRKYREKKKAGANV